MTPKEWHAYLKDVQDNDAVNQEALSSYAQLANLLNAAVRTAASAVMQFEDEPAHFLCALRELRR